jgi:hypothetical protein
VRFASSAGRGEREFWLKHQQEASHVVESALEDLCASLVLEGSGRSGGVLCVHFPRLTRRSSDGSHERDSERSAGAGPHHDFNDAISIVVLCDDQAELDRYWNALLKGGGKEQACGWLIDRFGLRWQIVPAVLDEMMRDDDPRS